MNVMYDSLFSLQQQLNKTIRALFNNLYTDLKFTDESLNGLAADFTILLNSTFEYSDIRERQRIEQIISKLLKKIPEIRKILINDIKAAYNGDPAAANYMEILITYPFVKAITIHRVAHELYELKVPILPRMLSEWAHMTTGIDIHPGACIGECFFIDHGTGVVIGETTVIGNHVKIYQGVTLGAVSFPKDEGGNIIKGKKRHPTIKDNVVIYANATILGGDTVIGENCIIGGNVWITDSVKDNTIVTDIDKKPKFKKIVR